MRGESVASSRVTCAKGSAMAAQSQSWCRGSNGALSRPRVGRRAKMPVRRPVRGLVKVDVVASWLATFEVHSWHKADIPRSRLLPDDLLPHTHCSVCSEHLGCASTRSGRYFHCKEQSRYNGRAFLQPAVCIAIRASMRRGLAARDVIAASSPRAW